MAGNSTELTSRDAAPSWKLQVFLGKNISYCILTVLVGQLRPAANECNRSPLVPTNRPYFGAGVMCFHLQDVKQYGTESRTVDLVQSLCDFIVLMSSVPLPLFINM